MTRTTWVSLLGGALFIAAALLLPNYPLILLTQVGVSALVAVGLVLLTGITGLTSFGHAALVGVGAYVAAYLATDAGWNPGLTLLAVLLSTTTLATILGLMTVRLAAHFLPLGTLAWGIAIYYLFGALEPLGGMTGISGIPGLTLFGQPLDRSDVLFVIVWAVVFIAILGCRNLLDSRIGRAVRMLRSAPGVVESFGVSVARLRLVVFMISALLAGVAGWLYAYTQRFVNPTPFSAVSGIEYLFMIVLGGAGSLAGAVLGAVALTGLREGLREGLSHIAGAAGAYELIVLGVILIVTLHRLPRGLVGLLPRTAGRAAGTPARSAHAAAGPSGARSSAPARGVLRLERVGKRFGGLVAIDGLSFIVPEREIVGLIGPNGAGKSTTFNVLSGLLAPDAGEIHFGPHRIDHSSMREIAELGIGRTFQHVQLHREMSVLENAAVGATAHGRSGVLRCMVRADRDEEARILERASAALRRVGLAEVMHRAAGSLSLGQQRLIEVARALCATPSLLLLDEPAAGLRHLEKTALAELLVALRAEGMTILVVEHDMDFLMRIADRLVVMDFGRKIAEGSPAEVRADPRVQEAYLGVAA